MEMDIGGSSISDGEGNGDSTNRTSNSTLSTMTSSAGGSKLKRSSSAPMIHQLMPQLPISAPPTPSPSSCDSLSCELSIQPRMRRLSASFGPVSPLSPGGTRSSGRMRVCQLREEEGMDVVNREAAHENKLHSTITLSQSWEDLALTEDRKPFPTNNNKTYSELSLTITPHASSSQNNSAASPTRVGRQCFSPSLQQPIRNTTFCPTPSPTKKIFTTRRPLSPIPLRPSPLGGSRGELRWTQVGVKRKSDMEDSFLTPNKRLSVSTNMDKFGGLIIPHPQSIVNLESSQSPAGSRSVGTPDSLCSGGSPGALPPPYSPAITPDPPPHCFKPVSPALTTAPFGSNSDRGGEESFMPKPRTEDSTDEMITDTPMQVGPNESMRDIKSYQDMELSDSLPPESI